MKPRLNKFEKEYLRKSDLSRKRRMRWWNDARFGMFIHWGLYSQLGRTEWVMNREKIPVKEYEKLAATWNPTPNVAREWAALAKRAGMKYMVLTTKHHEGFLLWDSKVGDYNAVRRGPGRDLVREYVDAAREFGLRVGLYYSLMDWRHPDCARAIKSEKARRRFLDYTQGCVRELCSNYGKIDLLWYDIPWPFKQPRQWESYEMNSMVRELQPDIIINNRSRIPEDYSTPEDQVKPEQAGRAWEACMTFNAAWGWQPNPPDDWRPVRSVVDMLCTCTAHGGNLLLNIGPKADGSVPDEAIVRLKALGDWLRKYGNVVYGKCDATDPRNWMNTGRWSRKGNTLYFWCHRWPGSVLAIGGMKTRLQSAFLLPDRKKLGFTQEKNRLIIRGLPATNPDKIANVAIIEMNFNSTPKQNITNG